MYKCALTVARSRIPPCSMASSLRPSTAPTGSYDTPAAVISPRRGCPSLSSPTFRVTSHHQHTQHKHKLKIKINANNTQTDIIRTYVHNTHTNTQNTHMHTRTHARTHTHTRWRAETKGRRWEGGGAIWRGVPASTADAVEGSTRHPHFSSRSSSSSSARHHTRTRTHLILYSTYSSI